MIWYALSQNRVTQTCNAIWLSLLTLYTRLRNWYKKHISIQFTLFNHNNGSRLAVYARLRLLARLSDDKCSNRGAHTFQFSSIPWKLWISIKKIYRHWCHFRSRRRNLNFMIKRVNFARHFRVFLSTSDSMVLGRLTRISITLQVWLVISQGKMLFRALSRLPPCLDP